MNPFLFSIKDGINALLWYHYGIIICAFVLSLLFIIVAFITFKKKLLSSIMFLLSALLLFVGMPIALIFVEDYVRHVEIVDLNTTKLVYSPIVVVKGTMKNDSKIPVETEYFHVKITGRSNNWVTNTRMYFNPVLEQDFKEKIWLEKNESDTFQLLVDYGDKKMPNNYTVYISYKAL